MNISRIIKLLLILVVIAGNVRAQGCGKERREFILHFRFDRSLVDSGYRDNRHVLGALCGLFTDSADVARIDSVRIRAYSSPEGNSVYNARLARKRARALKGYLVWKYSRLNQRRIYTASQVEDWKSLSGIIENDSAVPCRDEVLQILALHKNGESVGTLLKKLNGGVSYRYIARHILPELRNASICTVYLRSMKHPQSARPESGGCSSVVPRSPVEAPLQVAAEDYKYARYLADMERLHPRRVPLIALKTNLLFDLAMMPNVELELPIGNRYSLNGELMFPWWLFDGDKYCLQILSGGLEGRYWFGNRERHRVLNGHFVGLYAGGGKYDLQWDNNGYQGEFFIAAGISYGYAMNIARNLNLEFSLGVGLLRTSYEHYHARDNYQTLLWQNNGRYTWIGPTKAKISLVWMLNRKAKRGGEK